MATLSDHKGLRWLTLSALYFAQGVPWGFISVGYVVLLADLGLDATAIGAAMGLAYLPWSFKILWGPLLDAVPSLRIGRRRPFIVFAELMMGLTLLGLLTVDPVEQLPMVSFLLFLHNTFAALQDVAVDALAVDILDDEERGTANALMWAGKSLGVVFGGGGGTLIAKYTSWSTLFVAMAIILWLIMLLPLMLRERAVHDDDEALSPGLLRLGVFLGPFLLVGAVMYSLSTLEGMLGDHWAAPLVSVAQPFAAVGGALLGWPLVDRKGFRAMRESFSFSTPWWALLAGILTPAGYAMIGPAMSKLVRADLQLSEERIAFLSGVIDPAAGVVGALVGGVVADRLGAKRSIGLFMGAVGGMLLIWGLTEPQWGWFTWLIVWTALFQGLVNGYNAGSLGLFMTVSNPRIGATHFAVYMAATNLTYAWTAPVGGMIADRFGFSVLFMVAGALQLLTIVLLLPIDLDAARARWPHPAAHPEEEGA